MKTKPPVKRSQGRTPFRPARPVGADCDTRPILNQLPAGNLVRDLAGRLFIVEQLKCSGYGAPYRDDARREVSYSEALAFIAKHTRWKHPWKVLAHHGIKRPSAASAGRARPGRRFSFGRGRGVMPSAPLSL